jgi:Outer membrane protein beta-barrel domain
MKDAFTALLLPLLLGVASAQAQSVRFGLKAGVNYSTLTSIISPLDTDRLARKPGLLIGGTANFAINQRFSVQPELLFSMQGAQASSNSDFKYNLNYLSLPIIGRLKVSGLFFEAGPQLGLLLSAHNKQNAYSRNIQPGMKKLDLGYAAGLGYALSDNIEVGFRYQGGVSKIFDYYISEDASLDNRTPRNSTLQVHIGYQLGNHSPTY